MSLVSSEQETERFRDNSVSDENTSNLTSNRTQHLAPFRSGLKKVRILSEKITDKFTIYYISCCLVIKKYYTIPYSLTCVYYLVRIQSCGS